MPVVLGEDFLAFRAAALRCVTDHLLGTYVDAEATVVALAVIDDSQVLVQSDGTLGADLLTQTAADAADGAATGGDIALCVGGAGDDDVLAVLHGVDDATGAGGSTAHAADTLVEVNTGNTVHNVDGIVLAGLDAVAEAQTA